MLSRKHSVSLSQTHLADSANVTHFTTTASALGPLYHKKTVLLYCASTLCPVCYGAEGSILKGHCYEHDFQKSKTRRLLLFTLIKNLKIKGAVNVPNFRGLVVSNFSGRPFRSLNIIAKVKKVSGAEKYHSRCLAKPRIYHSTQLNNNLLSLGLGI